MSLGIYDKWARPTLDKLIDSLPESAKEVKNQKELMHKVLSYALPITCLAVATIIPLSTVVGGAVAGAVTQMNWKDTEFANRSEKIAVVVSLAALTYFFLPLLFTVSAAGGFAGADFSDKYCSEDRFQGFESFKNALNSFVTEKTASLKGLFSSQVETPAI